MATSNASYPAGSISESRRFVLSLQLKGYFHATLSDKSFSLLVDNILSLQPKGYFQATYSEQFLGSQQSRHAVKGVLP